MSKIISKDDFSDYQEWAVPTVVTDQGSQDSDSAHSNPNLLTANQIEQVQKLAHDEAFEIGYKEGLEAGKNEVQNRMLQLEQLMQALEKPFTELDQQVEEELVTLAITLVKHMLRREIKIDPGQIVAVVREAVAALPVVDRSVRLHLHPDDAVIVREALSLSEDERAWMVIDDPVLSRGRCKVVTENSLVDATLESRLSQIISTVFGGDRETDGTMESTQSDETTDG